MQWSYTNKRYPLIEDGVRAACVSIPFLEFCVMFHLIHQFYSYRAQGLSEDYKMNEESQHHHLVINLQYLQKSQ